MSFIPVLLFSITLSLLGAPASSPASSQVTVGVPPDRGIYAIWIKNEKVLDLPFIKGSQVMVLWSDCEVGEGKYDFSKMDALLKQYHDRGMKCTVQVNGNKKPAWMFSKIPYYPEKVAKFGMADDKTLMFWHPRFIEAYVKFIAAYADHLKTSPYRENILGVRMNFNAVGTEHLSPGKAADHLEKWIQPDGSKEPLPGYSKKVQQEYQKTVFEAHVKNFSPDIFLFLRANVSEEIAAPHADLFASGHMGWFVTGALPIESPHEFFQTVYGIFGKYTRTGKALGYAEPIKDSFGYGGAETKDLKYLGPARFNYWRLLLDLHYGISYIACYGEDLSIAVDGKNTSGSFPDLKPFYTLAFQFADKYAGYLNDAAHSPGAWVALRQADHPDPKLIRTDDCEFLMKRLPDDSKGVTDVGPKDQGYGGWARVLAPGKIMRFRLDERFALSLEEAPFTASLIYLDNGTGKLTLRVSGKELPIEMKNTGRFEKAQLQIGPSHWAAGGPDISVENTEETDATLHMLEITRAVKE